MTTCCPHCHQPIRVERFGVHMTSIKAAIVDRIKAAGDVGVSSAEIVADLYRDRRPVKTSVIKSHILQIRELIERTGWCIYSDRRSWFMRREHLL